ncbi:MAG: hypothetical protein AB1898_24705 [Acidobacteriota bacterium]
MEHGKPPSSSRTLDLRSRYMQGRPGQLVAPDSFAASNVRLSPAKYSYEGDWLFCSFKDAEWRAARIGFGRGKLDWTDYGVDDLPIADNALFWRVELIGRQGIYAFVSSDPSQGDGLASNEATLQVKFEQSGERLFQIEGWPDARWEFQSPGGALQVRLQVQPQKLAVWPDFVMPNNTFSMCLGSCRLGGTMVVEGGRQAVEGWGVFDHPRIVVEKNAVPPFGWYLYAPLCFSCGTQVISYYSQDGLGSKDRHYSMGFVTDTQGTAHWLTDHRVTQLKVGESDLPLSWSAELTGEEASVSYQARILDVPMIRGWGNANLPGKGKYPGYPLLMEAEGECRIRGHRRKLENGGGICEFLVRKNLQPRYP